MNKFGTFLVLLGIFISQIDSHSLPMSKSMQKRIRELKFKNELPNVWSYHIHCLFINGDNTRVKSALELRNTFVNHFNLTNVQACTSTFDDIRLCMFGKK